MMEKMNKQERIEIACKTLYALLMEQKQPMNGWRIIYETDVEVLSKGSYVRQAVHELRMRGIPVCSSYYGYWIGRSDAEIQQCAGRLMSRAIKIMMAARNMICVLDGQMTIDEVFEKSFLSEAEVE